MFTDQQSKNNWVQSLFVKDAIIAIKNNLNHLTDKSASERLNFFSIQTGCYCTFESVKMKTLFS